MIKYLFIIRHGERIDQSSEKSNQKLPVNDAELSTKGKEQAVQTGNEIFNFLKKKHILISDTNWSFISSPFSRTIQTSINIRKGIFENSQKESQFNKLKISLLPCLSQHVDSNFTVMPKELLAVNQQLDNGKLLLEEHLGMSLEEAGINKNYNKNELPKCHESIDDVKKRARKFVRKDLKMLIKDIKKSKNQNTKGIVLITHAPQAAEIRNELKHTLSKIIKREVPWNYFNYATVDVFKFQNGSLLNSDEVTFVGKLDLHNENIENKGIYVVINEEETLKFNRKIKEYCQEVSNDLKVLVDEYYKKENNSNKRKTFRILCEYGNNEAVNLAKQIISNMPMRIHKLTLLQNEEKLMQMKEMNVIDENIESVKIDEKTESDIEIYNKEKSVIDSFIKIKEEICFIIMTDGIANLIKDNSDFNVNPKGSLFRIYEYDAKDGFSRLIIKYS